MDENTLNNVAENEPALDPETPIEVKEYVQPDMLIGDIIKDFPIAVRALMECGMGCINCPSAQMETIEEAAKVHGLAPDLIRKYVNFRISTVEELQANATTESDASETDAE